MCLKEKLRNCKINQKWNILRNLYCCILYLKAVTYSTTTKSQIHVSGKYVRTVSVRGSGTSAIKAWALANVSIVNEEGDRNNKYKDNVHERL